MNNCCAEGHKTSHVAAWAEREAGHRADGGSAPRETRHLPGSSLARPHLSNKIIQQVRGNQDAQQEHRLLLYPQCGGVRPRALFHLASHLRSPCGLQYLRNDDDNGTLIITSWTHDHKVLCSDGSGRVFTTENKEGSWEKWRISRQPGTHGVRIQSVEHDRFLAFSGHDLYTMDKEEDTVWHLEPAHGNQFFISETCQDKRLSSSQDHPFTHHNRKPWEKWVIEPTYSEMGNFTIRSLEHGKYLGSEQDGRLVVSEGKHHWSIEFSPHEGSVIIKSVEHDLQLSYLAPRANHAWYNQRQADLELRWHWIYHDYFGSCSTFCSGGIVGAMGFGSGGIAAGSMAAGMMSAEAIAAGGGVAAGGTVATLQSIGAAGLGAAGASAAAATGAVVGGLSSAGVAAASNTLVNEQQSNPPLLAAEHDVIVGLDGVAHEGPVDGAAVDGVLAEEAEGLDREALVRHLWRLDDERSASDRMMAADLQMRHISTYHDGLEGAAAGPGKHKCAPIFSAASTAIGSAPIPARSPDVEGDAPPRAAPLGGRAVAPERAPSSSRAPQTGRDGDDTRSFPVVAAAPPRARPGGRGIASHRQAQGTPVRRA
ncbi:hypothetical protein THAOC_05944, partial [Thalassiosira oceanica]